ncbi:MAG: glycosyltransferase involved in cell wall biosynthesis [Gammaproteobacteria bacterium]|jgi:glycosyltransferase involved in cell wall biosynthesis
MSIDYSIIIPAYNEEDYLTTTLNALQEAMPLVELSGEIIVVDNNSSDRTAEIAEANGVKVVFEAINQISRARNAGAKEAQGRYLIFVDADTVIPHALLQQALVNLENGEIIGGGACVSGDVPLHFSMQCLLNFWNFISIQTRNAAGSFIYCQREDFETIGGFSEAVYASEEIWLSRSLKKLGKKRKQKFCIIKQPPVITSMRKIQWYSPMRIYLYVLLLTVFPFTVRIKSLCTMWYRRPS